MFGEIVAEIGMARPPIDSKTYLSHTILYPIIPHVHGLGLLLLNLFVCKTGGGCVVDLDGGWGFRMYHLVKGGVEGNSFFSVVEKGPTFGFRCGRDDIAHDGGSV